MGREIQIWTPFSGSNLVTQVLACEASVSIEFSAQKANFRILDAHQKIRKKEKCPGPYLPLFVVQDIHTYIHHLFIHVTPRSTEDSYNGTMEDTTNNGR